MKMLKISAIAILSMGMFACGGGNDEAEAAEDLMESIDELTESIEAADAMNDSNEFFDIDVPSRMKTMYDLNQEATVQYGYVEEVGTEVMEHYLIVLTETKEEIDSYELDMEFDAMSYRDISVESLAGGLDEYEILTKDPKVENVNGMDCVKNEMRGALYSPQGNINVFYKLGVFEGKKAFYQVLTWCIEEQKAEFAADMDAIINSFKEK